MLGLVLPDIANPLFPKIAQADRIICGLRRRLRHILIADSAAISRHPDGGNQPAGGARRRRNGDQSPRRATRISAEAAPVALSISTSSTPGNTVAADHWQGGQEIAAHLAGLGHYSVLIIGNNQESNVQNDSTGGISSGTAARACTQKRCGSKAPGEEDRQRPPAGPRGKARQGFTAFAALSDLQALRALTELQQAGSTWRARRCQCHRLRHSYLVTCRHATLTTVRMDMESIAEIAVSALVDRNNEGGTREGALVTAKTGNALCAAESSASHPACEPGTKTSMNM